MRRALCLAVFAAVLAAASPASAGIEKLTIAARVCPSYSAITANEARNNIQETLQPLGKDTPYQPNDAMDPQVEADNQPLCTALAGWHFTLGTGIASTKSVGVWGSLSLVSGAYPQSIVTLDSTPLLDTQGASTGKTIQGAVTITLTAAQSELAAKASQLWIQGGTPSTPVANPEAYAFGALRCGVDNLNGDNVEWISAPNPTTHVFCFAYYVQPPPQSGTVIVRKRLTVPTGGTISPVQTVRFTGNISYEPDPSAPTDPSRNFFTVRSGQTDAAVTSGQATFYRAGGTTWSFREDSPPAGSQFDNVTCTSAKGTSVVPANQTNPAVSVQLAAGDVVTCTFNNSVPPPGTLVIRKISRGGVGTFDFDVVRTSGGTTHSVKVTTTEDGIAAGEEVRNLTPGTYRITEHDKTSDEGNWSLQTVVCGTTVITARPVEINVPSSGAICTFTDRFTPKGRIIIHKVTLGATATTGFVISTGFGEPVEYHQSATTTDEDKPALATGDSTSALELGTYFIRELTPSSVPGGAWRLSAVVCNGGRVVLPTEGGGTTVTLTESRPVVDCTITDTFTREPTPTPTPPEPGPGPAPPVPTPVPGPPIAGQGASADPIATLVLSKRASRTRVRVGQSVDYVLTIRNRGPVAAEGVTIVERQAYVGGRIHLHTTKGVCREIRPRYCIIGALAPGESARVSGTVRQTEPGRHTNVAATNVGTSTRSLGAQVAFATIVVLPRAGVRPNFTG
jgi:hypothetical protein